VTIACASDAVPKRSPKRGLFLIVPLCLCLGLLAWAMQKPRVTVVIKNPKFEVVSAEVIRGQSHRLYLNGWPMGQILDLLSRAGVLPGNNAPGTRMLEVTYALRARFTGSFGPNELSGVQALAVNGSNASAPLRVLAGYNMDGTPSQYGGL